MGSSTVTQSLISPVRYFTALLLTHFSTHFTTTLFAAHLFLLLLPLSLFLYQNSMSKLMFLKAHSRKILLTSFSLSVFNSFTAFILCSRGRKLMVIFGHFSDLFSFLKARYFDVPQISLLRDHSTADGDFQCSAVR